jgi:hypothetical protein
MSPSGCKVSIIVGANGRARHDAGIWYGRSRNDSLRLRRVSNLIFHLRGTLIAADSLQPMVVDAIVAELRSRL